MLRQNYQEFSGQNMSAIIEELTLSDLQKHFLQSRWLNQVLFMEAESNKARNQYYILRLIAVIGGIIIPALVSLNIIGTAVPGVLWGTFGLSLVVAVSVAVEEIFHFGRRWRHYRQTVGCLKIEGWKYFQLSSPYQNYSDHEDAYPLFASRIESIIQRDAEVYITTEVVHERKDEKEKQKSLMSTNSKTDKFEIAGQSRIES
ncbi:MAG: DUF4231 domain-containing protein [wastewater metagenome]|nr:DUF4231 domain-containing protein [Candidatus Loosdrechtia aerotolerans]